MPAVVDKFFNPFINLFTAVAKIIDDYESKPIIGDNDINISNWVTQVLSNEDFEHVVDCKGKIKGNEFEFTTKAKFNPATMKGNATTYQKGLRDGVFYKEVANENNASVNGSKTHKEKFTTDEYPDAVSTLLAYVLGWLVLGKPLATVNMARGKIFLSMVDMLKITELTAVIHSISLGGSKPKADIEINQAELTLLAEYHSLRGQRIMNRLDGVDNSTSHVNAVTRDAVTSIKPMKYV
jgi:hypothetical protein